MLSSISKSVIAAALVWSSTYAQLPEWDNEQSEVWEFVQQSWVDDVAENGRWPAEYIHEKVIDWGDTQAAPRGAEQILEWTRFEDAGSQTLYYEITPAAIVVEDDTAVVHYHLLTVSEDHAGDRETSVLSLVEVLVRQRGDWRYISLTGFTPKFGDD